MLEDEEYIDSIYGPMRTKTLKKAKKAKRAKKATKPKKPSKLFLKVHKFLINSIKENDYYTGYCIINEIKEFKTLGTISDKDFKKLEEIYFKKLKNKLKKLRFVDVSNKILPTTFYCMSQTANLALRGPPGVGKSFFAKKILPELWKKENRIPTVITIQPDRNMDVASLIVEKGLKEGSTVPEEGQIYDAMELARLGNRVILVLEEINQWPTKVIKDLNDFLQERRIEKKISGVDINLECPKDNLLVIANYNPEGDTLGEDETGSVSSRFIFCDLPFPSREDIQKIISMNLDEEEFRPLKIGYERKKSVSKNFLGAMADICYSIRSNIQQGDLGMMAMQLGTRHMMNFSKALFENNTIAEGISKTLVDPILEKYVREGIKANVDPKTYEEYVRTIYKAVKQIIGSNSMVNEKNLSSLKSGLSITINDLYKTRKKEAFNIDMRETKKTKEIPTISKPDKGISKKKIEKTEIKLAPISKESKAIKPSKREKKVISEKVKKEAKIIKESLLSSKYLVKCLVSDSFIKAYQTDLLGRQTFTCKSCKKPHEFKIEKHNNKFRLICLACNEKMKRKPRLGSKFINFSCDNKKCKNFGHPIQISRGKEVSEFKKVATIICPKCFSEMKIIRDKKRILFCAECSKIFNLPLKGKISTTSNICSDHKFTILEITSKNEDTYKLCPKCWELEGSTCTDCRSKCF